MRFSIRSRLVQLTVAAAFLLGISWFLLPSSRSIAKHIRVPHVLSPPPPKTYLKPKENHPIDRLVLRAQEEFRSLVSKETKNLHDAGKAYRERRGRQPPPGFDVWFHFAANNSALIVEDFFDRIYDDLGPFWGIPAKQIREQANVFLHKISVRNGKATGMTDDVDRPWVPLWEDMIQSVAAHLPDIDVAINVLDESRVVVPWEEINSYMAKEKISRVIVPEEKLKTKFGSLKDLDAQPPEPFDPEFVADEQYWSLAVVGCPPTSPARRAYIETDFTQPPPLDTSYPLQSYQGYVQNWTFVKSPCDHPMLQGLHGTFVEPVTISNTRKLIPLFGGSKLPMNNEILIPPAMYWTDDPFYSGGKGHGQPWHKKKDRLIWRGAATGGRNRENNWTRFQRHRFVSMMNATNVEGAVQGSTPPRNFVLPSNGTYDLAVHAPGAGPSAFSEWVASWSDAAVVHLVCFPEETPSHCSYSEQYFTAKKAMPMQKQYANKYLPDIDGNSFSGRYRGFLGSTSMPIKATIYQEWHDSRMIPWKHFVPMDNTFIDIFGIMEYFVGNEMLGLGGHDEVAKGIALDGKEWTEKVLRKVDMSIYVLRLLLEYARLCDDDRDRMGWAEDAVT